MVANAAVEGWMMDCQLDQGIVLGSFDSKTPFERTRQLQKIFMCDGTL